MRKLEIRKSTAYQILIKPEDGVDVMVLEAMAIRAKANPLLLTMTYGDGVAVISVELNNA